MKHTVQLFNREGYGGDSNTVQTSVKRLSYPRDQEGKKKKDKKEKATFVKRDLRYLLHRMNTNYRIETGFREISLREFFLYYFFNFS